MVEQIVSLISPSNILELPPLIMVPGLLVLALLAVRFVRAILALKPLRSISSVIMFVVVAFILSRFGSGIAQMLESQSGQ